MLMITLLQTGLDLTYLKNTDYFQERLNNKKAPFQELFYSLYVSALLLYFCYKKRCHVCYLRNIHPANQHLLMHFLSKTNRHRYKPIQYGIYQKPAFTDTHASDEASASFPKISPGLRYAYSTEKSNAFPNGMETLTSISSATVTRETVSPSALNLK